MPRIGGLLKKQRDDIKCSYCGKVLGRRYIEDHWKLHQKRPPIHPSNTAIKDMVKEIMPKSNIFNFFSVATNTNHNIDNDIIDEVAEQTPEPQPQPSQATIIYDMFAAMSKDAVEKDKIITQTGYLLQSIKEILDMIREKRDCINVDMFVERNENDYQSLYDLLLQSRITFKTTENLLINIEKIVEMREYDVCNLEDLLLKFSFHGLRISEHEDDECLLYCCCCTKDPSYPKQGRGTIKSGLINDKYRYKDEDNINLWRSTKRICNDHFHHDNGHFMHLESNKDRFKDLNFRCKYNQFGVENGIR